MTKKVFMFFAFLCVAVQGAWALDGAGTETNPYLIRTTADWNEFAQSVTNGNTYAGKYLQLENDITVTMMAGTTSKLFEGNFDGCDHTLTVNYQTTEDYAAPFRGISGATIRRLVIDGTISSSNTHLGGLVGVSKGDDCNIESCWVKAKLTTTASGDITSGGFIAFVRDNYTTFSNCTFTGQFIAPTAHSVGGFVGWTEFNNRAQSIFKNCVFAPKQMDIIETNCNPFSRGRYLKALGLPLDWTEVVFYMEEPSYHTQSLGYEPSCWQMFTMPIYETEPDDEIYFYISGAGKDNAFTGYTPCFFKFINSSYLWNGDQAVKASPLVEQPTTYQYYKRLAEGTDYTVSYLLEGQTEEQPAMTSVGNYTVILRGKGDIFKGEKRFNTKLYKASYQYYDENNELQTSVCEQYTLLEGNKPGDWEQIGVDGDEAKYYVVNGNVARKTLTVFGEAHIIVPDGAKLTCKGGIKVEAPQHSNLHIHSQSRGEKQGYIYVENSYEEACGIGSGADDTDCGSIRIHGGVLEVYGNDEGWAFGSWKSGEASKGTLILPPDYQVSAGWSAKQIERTFTTPERVPACWWRHYAKVEPCTEHRDFVYTTDDEFPELNHVKRCLYCEHSEKEQHTEGNCVCGYQNETRTMTLYEQDGSDPQDARYEEWKTYEVAIGQKFYLPSPFEDSYGYKFLGWEMNPDPENIGPWLYTAGEAIIKGGEYVEITNDMTNAKFYPRFIYDFFADWEWSDDCSSAEVSLNEGYHHNPNSFQLDENNVNITHEEKDGVIIHTATATYSEHGYDYIFTEQRTTLLLYGQADNSELLEQQNEESFPCVELRDRKFYLDGSWNTICLPFGVYNLSLVYNDQLPTVKQLVSSTFADGTLTLNFEEPESVIEEGIVHLEAGVPYLIKWDNIDEVVNSPVLSFFLYLDIDNTLHPVETEYVDFVGCFSPVGLQANDRNVLYLGEDNTLYFPSENMSIGSCRAFFRLKGDLLAGDPASHVNAINLNFDDDEVTSIDHETIDHSPLNIDHEAWYDLSGRKLNAKPTQKGLYIHNGKKIIIH